MYTDYVVADLMTIDPVSIGPDAWLADAEQLMELYDVTGLPVVEDGGAVVGVVSQTDLLRDGTSVTRPTSKRITRLHVADVMTSPAITVDVDTPLVEAAKLMQDKKIHRVVAVSKAGHAVGVLSSMDFVRLYAEG
jgi:CBS domain-containing protein